MSRPVAILLIFFSGLFIGRYLLPSSVGSDEPIQFVSTENGQRQLVFPTFWEAWDTLHENFIGQLDEQELFYGAVAGMVRATGDPYTSFADPDETKQFEENIEGSFSGIGVEIGMRNGVVTVIAPLEGSPAKAAGVKAEDIIVAIDGQPITPDMTLDEVVGKIRGPRGQTVVLTVAHAGSSQTEDIAIQRDTIQIESVRMTITNGIAHIEVLNFNGDTADRFLAAANQAARARVQGVVLDLRGNPGGFLQSAVDIASEFLPPGTLVVSEKGKDTDEYVARGSAVLQAVPVVVLVNEGSASASEILAGALRDQRSAPIVGTKTFGKGSVQEFLKLEDGSSLKVTVAKWFTPSGRSIDEQGITPTVTVEDNQDTAADEQLERAEEELQKLIP